MGMTRQLVEYRLIKNYANLPLPMQEDQKRKDAWFLLSEMDLLMTRICRLEMEAAKK